MLENVSYLAKGALKWHEAQTRCAARNNKHKRSHPDNHVDVNLVCEPTKEDEEVELDDPYANCALLFSLVSPKKKQQPFFWLHGLDVSSLGNDLPELS